MSTTILHVSETSPKVKTNGNGHGRPHERKPRRRRQPLTTEQRALLALQIMGTAYPSMTKAAAAVGVSASYVATLRDASPEERRAVRKGELTLSALHNKKQTRRPPSDADVERAVVELGIDRVWRVVERLTQPTLFAGE